MTAKVFYFIIHWKLSEAWRRGSRCVKSSADHISTESPNEKTSLVLNPNNRQRKAGMYLWKYVQLKDFHSYGNSRNAFVIFQINFILTRAQISWLLLCPSFHSKFTFNWSILWKIIYSHLVRKNQYIHVCCRRNEGCGLRSIIINTNAMWIGVSLHINILGCVVGFK